MTTGTSLIAPDCELEKCLFLFRGSGGDIPSQWLLQADYVRCRDTLIVGSCSSSPDIHQGLRRMYWAELTQPGRFRSGRKDSEVTTDWSLLCEGLVRSQYEHLVLFVNDGVNDMLFLWWALSSLDALGVRSAKKWVRVVGRECRTPPQRDLVLEVSSQMDDHIMGEWTSYCEGKFDHCHAGPEDIGIDHQPLLSLASHLFPRVCGNELRLSLFDQHLLGCLSKGAFRMNYEIVGELSRIYPAIPPAFSFDRIVRMSVGESPLITVVNDTVWNRRSCQISPFGETVMQEGIVNIESIPSVVIAGAIAYSLEGLRVDESSARLSFVRGATT